MPKVLLVTAENYMLQLLEAKFVEEGFDVTTARNVDAIRLARDLVPDLIVLEQRLVDQRGRPLKEQFAASQELKDIPIILLTVRDGSDGDEVSVAMPFRPKQLVALARDAL